MQPQEYTISQFNAGDFKDNNGNIWCNVLFVEKSNEPMRWVVKDPSTVQVGQKVYGHIETKTSQAGKPYLRFYRDQRPDDTRGNSGGAGGSKPHYQPKDEHAIAKAVALKAAVDSWAGRGDVNDEKYIDRANVFLAWLESDKQPESPVATNDAEFDSLTSQGMPYEGQDISFND